MAGRGSHERVRGFDGLRGIAAMTVVAIHLGAFVSLTVRQVRLLAPVTMFFVLSGFLITRNLLLEGDRAGSVSLRRFWRNRIVRIAPCYVAFLIAIGAAKLSGFLPQVGSKQFVLSALYVSNFVDRAHYSGPLGSTWSLAVEEHFYLLWPLVFVLVPTRWFRPLVVMGLCACVIARAVLYWHPGRFANYYYGRFTIPAADAILVGCLLAAWLSSRDPKMVARQRSTHPVILGLLAVGLYVAPLWLPFGDSTLLDFSSYYVQLAGIAVGLWWVFTSQASPIVRALELRPIAYLGLISYGIYVWQGFWLGTGPADQTHWLQQPPQAIAVIIFTATASWYLIERPFLHLKHRPKAALASPLGRPH